MLTVDVSKCLQLAASDSEALDSRYDDLVAGLQSDWIVVRSTLTDTIDR
ncbi:hypothetical protein ACFRQM_47495 [Streptomyces sp. NPDC056831]